MLVLLGAQWQSLEIPAFITVMPLTLGTWYFLLVAPFRTQKQRPRRCRPPHTPSGRAEHRHVPAFGRALHLLLLGAGAATREFGEDRGSRTGGERVVRTGAAAGARSRPLLLHPAAFQSGSSLPGGPADHRPRLERSSQTEA
jgi:hypothetical protein